MKKEYDFGKAKRGPIVRHEGKTRVTIYLDSAVLGHFGNAPTPAAAATRR